MSVSKERLAELITDAAKWIARGYMDEQHLCALRELASLRERVRWRPIEEAPEDGRDVLVYCSDTKEQFVAFRKGDAYQYAYIRQTNTSIACRPTYWMPLPEIGPLPGGDA